MARTGFIGISGRTLPGPLKALPEFEALSEVQANGFLTRLVYIEQMANEISEWLFSQDSNTKEFLDNIELLLYVNQGGPAGAPKESVSAYLVHSSWTFDTSASRMQVALSATSVKALNSAPPTTESSRAEIVEWLQCQSSALKDCLTGFYEAKTLDGLLSHLVAIDAIICGLLLGTIRARFNVNC